VLTGQQIDIPRSPAVAAISLLMMRVRQEGFPDARLGHRYGAEHLDEILQWCAEILSANSGPPRYRPGRCQPRKK
jgi:hypothetical protein